MLKINYQRALELPTIKYGEEWSKNYGTMNFAIGELDTTRDEPVLFQIYVDVSASMLEIASKQQSKMSIVKHTLVNILHHFADKTTNVHVQIKGFDNRIHNYISPVLVSKDNINELLKSVEEIRPMNSTDIGLVLNELNRDVDTEYFNIPKRNRVGIVLTDGEPTSGICNVDELADIVKSECSYHFIALGNDHNETLMYKLGHKNCYTSNWFISDIEHTGNVYGEIIFNELHRVYYENVIRVTGGKVYDYNKGEFCSEIELGTLSEETNKDFHLLIDDETIFEITISGKLLDGDTVYSEKSHCSPTQDGDNMRITKQFLRLCVQKMMFEMRQQSYTRPHEHRDIQFGGFGLHRANANTCFPPTPCYHPPHPPVLTQMGNELEEEDVKEEDVKEENDEDPPPLLEEDIGLKENVDIFYEFITNFIKTNELEKDDFMIELLKDINVMKIGLDNQDVLKYVSSREDTQGRQRTFNTASQYDQDNSGLIQNDSLGRQPTSAYKTPRRCDLMREISNTTGL